MKNVEHIGIAVKDLEAAETLYASLFDTKPYRREKVASKAFDFIFSD